MNDRLTKLMGLFDLFYRVIILNTLFLVTNAFFFQVFFLFDFKVVFFPIYLLTSLTLLPSILALLRTAHTLKGENSSGIFGIYLRELRFTLRKEMHLSALLTLAFYLGMTTLYVSAVTGPITYLLYAMNIVLIVFEMSFGINLAREAISFKGTESIEASTGDIPAEFPEECSRIDDACPRCLCFLYAVLHGDHLCLRGSHHVPARTISITAERT